ncbi:bifunctional 4-hydroxy-2-oxoglutarate aldolase/2-dehydro-3-deoxy-phosphogluconate aldolase [Victivallis sp. Marseille-Q1083]|uniref:bifunctional 4-hydroxy-2-oxoglutarate aldolase/2-dehydro-3-deoxy-phosphogluconate aldolase n=1 Tax=Victivallis sp. Marseille-Q1083 TaxID=2717288 RepID=UPI00158DDF73|nr:bifunctional 4-hydroxy-2-oxoglutarate aldolase/2-dehydro-3-deoxy-phosphogluconate aldolase [Victivallis sp. Marseille-Q1083]
MKEAYAKSLQQVAEKLAKFKIIPVLELEELDSGLKMCELLVENGLPVAEITFRTPAAEAIIRAAVKRFPEMYIGAGTILSPSDLQLAFEAGARFAVAPGFNPTVVRTAVAERLNFVPGICTPSEIEQAAEQGVRFMKFFPALASGGPAYLKAVAAPYRQLELQFMPTGGVTLDNAAEFFAVREVAAVGGTWLGRRADIVAGNWEAIAANIRAAVERAKTL